MATIKPANDRDAPGGSPVIIDFAPRSLIRRQVELLITVTNGSEAIASQARRIVTETTTIFGGELVHELYRAVTRGPQHRAASAITLLLMIADEPARATLWTIADDITYHPTLRLDALRGLYQQGEAVEISALVALANACGDDDDEH